MGVYGLTMFNTNRLLLNSVRVNRFDSHVQAWRVREIEKFWLQAVLDDRVEAAVPPQNLWTPSHDR
jgi:hypothetical protein